MRNDQNSNKNRYFNQCKLWEPPYLATWYTLGLFSFLVLLWVQIMVFQGTWINKTHLDIVVLLLLSRARDPCMSPSLRFAQRPRQYIIGLPYWYCLHQDVIKGRSHWLYHLFQKNPSHICYCINSKCVTDFFGTDIISTPNPWLTQIHFTWISQHAFSKISHSSLNTCYEKEIPSLTHISLHVELINLVHTNFY
jgi:hypothetical protein